MPTQKLSHDDYTIGWICALPCEMAAATAMLDERHEDLPKRRLDTNAYTLGCFGAHNVVIACLPSGNYGTSSAATVAAQLLNSFQSVRFGVLVGIGGGVPGREMDIRLGDIVVSKPSDTFGGVVQYDLGKTSGDGSFVRTGSLNKPPTALLTAVAKLEAEHLMRSSKVTGFLSEMVASYPEMKAKFTYPGLENDRLFRADYKHEEGENTCKNCSKSMELNRGIRPRTSPQIHYGIIASGGQVMRHGQTRDRLGKELGVICFEMEASGLMDNFPCLVVRGICDYADSHKADRWREYAAATAAAYAKELLSVIPVEVVQNATVATEAITDSEENYDMPFYLQGCPSIGAFVGRSDDLQTMADYLSPTGQQQMLVIHGLGGMGKTQLALEFAKIYQGRFSSTFWIDGKTEQTLKMGFAAISQEILAQSGLSKVILSSQDQSLEHAVTNTLRWLQRPKNFRWLLILDGIDNHIQHTQYAGTLPRPNSPTTAYDVRKYLSPLTHGTIILTTRVSALSQLGKGLQLNALPLGDSVEILQRSCAQLEATDIDVLGKRLGGLPLALNHAGCYMAQRRISAGEYLRRYDRELADRKKLLNHIPRLSSYNASLMTTWEISFEAVAKESQNAAKLLLLCSFFHNANISFHLFKQFNLPDIPWLHELAKDLSCFEDEVEILLNFSFLQPTEGRHSGSFSIHPVVQDWGRDRLSQEAWLKTMQHSILIISTAIPSTESAEDWTCRLNLLPHAARCREFLDNCSATASESLFCLNIIGRLFLECSELKQAENMFLDAIKVYNRSFGLYEHQTLSAMTDLAVVYHSQGRFSKAKETLQTVIAASEEMDDEGYSILAAAGLNLSKIYLDEDNLSQAREALLLAMAHQDSASKNQKLGLYGSLVTLAIIFRREAKFQDGEGLLYAEMLLEQAKEGFESILGTGDLSVYRCFNNLANVYWDQGRRSDAIAAYTQALEGYEKILGPDHISTYGVLIQLCELDGKGDLIKAESLCQEALRVHERSLGPRHSSTLMCMSELGIIYQGKRELEKAEDYARRAYKGFEETMGSDHSSTVSLLANLASVYGDQQRFAEAKSLFEEALARSERAVGLDSLPTLGILANLAHVYADLKMLEQAHTLYKRVTEGYAKSLGPDHIKTVDMIGRFACFHASQGNHLEAKPRFDEAVKGYLRIYGPNHSRTIETLAQQSTTNQILDDVSKNVLEYPTSDIQYHVYCGKPEPGGISYEYDFVEKIPRILCDQNPLGRTEEQRSITGHVIQQIVSRHNDEILHSRNWSCEICGKPARELLHSALPFFVPGERASADFEPMLIDTAVPICRSAGECDRKAVDMTHTFVKSTGHQLNTNFKVCNQCGIDKGVKLCTGCRIIRYCSTSCQTLDWPHHKRNCKLARRSRS